MPFQNKYNLRAYPLDNINDAGLITLKEVIDIVKFQKGALILYSHGVSVLGRKAQKMQRHVAPLGQNEPGKVRWTVPQAGQLGFQTRTELNKKILKITSGFDIKGDFINYGKVSGDCLLLEGSVPGSRKRLIRMRFAIRPKKVYPVDIKYVSAMSKQGV